jgi:hypothetical protein
MKDYHTLTNAEKLEKMANVNFWRVHIHHAEEYARALMDGNQVVIDDYESFGGGPRQIIENKEHYEQGLAVYGITEKRFDEHGWLIRYAFTDCETFAFEVKKHVMGRNYITIGRSPNGKWTYGMNLAASQSGSCSGLSVYGPPFASRNGCLKDALKHFVQWHEKENDRKAASALKEAKDMLDTLTGRKPVQMSLFGCMNQ